MLGSKLSSKELEELIELSINEVERLKSQEIKRVNALNVFTSKFGQRCRDYGYRFKEDIDSCVTKEAVTEQRLVEYEAKIAQLERTIRENKIPTKEEKSDWDKFLQALVETGEELEKEEMKRDIESLKNQQRIERNRQNTKRAMDMLYRRPPTRY
jgi:regulatory protein YycI of two-component signal transduction system YycFG